MSIVRAASRHLLTTACGEVAEWSKALAWKVSIRQNRIAGSNPALSATDRPQSPPETPDFLALGRFRLVFALNWTLVSAPKPALQGTFGGTGLRNGEHTTLQARATSREREIPPSPPDPPQRPQKSTRSGQSGPEKLGIPFFSLAFSFKCLPKARHIFGSRFHVDVRIDEIVAEGFHGSPKAL